MNASSFVCWMLNASLACCSNSESSEHSPEIVILPGAVDSIRIRVLLFVSSNVATIPNGFVIFLILLANSAALFLEKVNGLLHDNHPELKTTTHSK